MSGGKCFGIVVSRAVSLVTWNQFVARRIAHVEFEVHLYLYHNRLGLLVSLVNQLSCCNLIWNQS